MPDQEIIMRSLLFVAPLAVSSVSLMAMHWFPYGRELERTTAYSLGTLATVGIPATVMLLAALLGIQGGNLYWAALLIVNALVSGATVTVCYWIDSKRAITLDEMADANANSR